jgi:starch synthase
VSQTYAREITTPEFGCGLDGLLRLRAERSELIGILNGIDESWNSLSCPDLVNPFEAGDWDGKRCNTVAVRRKFGLALGLVARLVHQKGIDLVGIEVAFGGRVQDMELQPESAGCHLHSTQSQ